MSHVYCGERLCNIYMYAVDADTSVLFQFVTGRPNRRARSIRLVDLKRRRPTTTTTTTRINNNSDNNIHRCVPVMWTTNLKKKKNKFGERKSERQKRKKTRRRLERTRVSIFCLLGCIRAHFCRRHLGADGHNNYCDSS